MKSSYVRGIDLPDAFLGAAPILAERRGPKTAPQFDHHFGARLVFQRLQILQCERFDRVQLLGREMRTAKDICKDFQGRRDVAGQRRAPKTQVHLPDAFAVIQAEAVHRQRQRPAIAIAGAARDHVRENRYQAKLIRRIVDAAGRHEKVDCGRAHVIHSFQEQRQAIGKRMLKDLLRHDGSPVQLGVDHTNHSTNVLPVPHRQAACVGTR